MKAKSFIFLAVVSGVVLGSFAVGEIEWPGDHDKGLVARANPTLAGIGELSVVIEPSNGDPNDDGFLWEQLDAKVYEKLGKNGVKVKKVASPARPQLRIAVDVLRLENCKMCVFHVQTSLSRRSVLEGPRKIHMKPDVWKAGTLMAAVQTDEMPGKVTEVVLEQVESFVTCLLMANPDGFEVSDTDGISEGKVGKKENQAERPVRGPYPFVASKNSKVFHIAGCRWADTIKQENLIGFAKRAEALQSGRRPCRRCGGQNDRRGR